MPTESRGSTGGRRPRLTEAEVRTRMLDAGVGMISADGLTVSLAHLSYEEVIRRAGVARSAGYRVWAAKEDYFDDLLVELAGAAWGGTMTFGPESVADAILALAEHADTLDTVTGRRAAWMHMCVVSAQVNLRHLVARREWRTYVTTAATLLSLPDAPLRRRVEEALRGSEQAFIAEMADLYRSLGATMGLRVRPETGGGFTLVAATCAAVLEGLALRSIISPDLVYGTFACETFGPGTPDTWTPAGLSVVALIDALIEPDPDFDEASVPSIREELLAQAHLLRTGGAAMIDA